jgi:hypothetical protein
MRYISSVTSRFLEIRLVKRERQRRERAEGSSIGSYCEQILKESSEC